MNQLYYQTFKIPFGKLFIYADEKVIKAVLFKAWQSFDATNAINKSTDLIELCRKQLDEYFAGDRRQFDLPLESNGTDFQKNVWQQLTKIPFGESRNYGEIASAIGNTKASRAVGAANGKNPISIIVPCHRVIGANGALTGYAGGLQAKQWLLKHEGLL
ncbi:methylated-DNA--[protein]-cysteine S-methyltransferase [Kangiella sp. HZ709]|uniref:methylated-DNA--[protein]-cysteine S-methyltransferase n=1 Tax=Kangiella sp. HZ709 TaxID=2666328 RepID=UPI0012B002BE|nr:methylated-DNA--[protein]-cysteine S-methyltransferase [Kangiella sp. HZ709]MRX28313.1 methylated-DNA--[protein]-cysteine S-methyltransferase [Kangiella sp. HZ709]